MARPLRAQVPAVISSAAGASETPKNTAEPAAPKKPSSSNDKPAAAEESARNAQPKPEQPPSPGPQGASGTPAVEPGQMYLEIKYGVDGTMLQGNRERSFLNEGINHLAEVSFFSNSPWQGTRRLEILGVGRYTDNPRIDPERNSLQRFYARLMGPTFEANFGDALVNYSRLTFNQNIRGLHGWKQVTEKVRLTATVGFFTDRWGSLYRDFSVFRNIALDCQAASLPMMPAAGCVEDPPGSNRFFLSPENPSKPYTRLVGGLRLEHKVGRNGWVAANWSHGKDQLQSLPEAVTVCEDSATGTRTVRPLIPGCPAGEMELSGARRPTAEAVNNDVLGMDTSLESRRLGLRLRAEFVYSWTAGGTPPVGANFNNFICASQPPIVGAKVLDARCFPSQVGDAAGRFEVSQRYRKVNWRVDYARYQPNFYAANSRQIRDLQDFNVRGDYEISRRMMLTASWRRSNDNLNGRRNYTSIVRAPEVRLTFRELPPYRRMSIEVGYRERNLDTAGNPLPSELRQRSTGIPFLSVSLPFSNSRFTFDYEHRHDSDAARPPLSSDTNRFAFGYRGNYSWNGWDFSPLFRFELERLDKNTPINPEASITDPALVFPADFFDAFDTNRAIQAGFLLEAPRYVRLEGHYREFNSLSLSSLRASAALDPQLGAFFGNEGFKRPSWRASLSFKVANDENKLITAYYERTNNFFNRGDPFVSDGKSFRETVIGGIVLLRFKR